MPKREELLRTLSPKKLRLLAEENGILLVNKNKFSFGRGLPLTSTEAIIEALLKSPKITKKKIKQKIPKKRE